MLAVVVLVAALAGALALTAAGAAPSSPAGGLLYSNVPSSAAGPPVLIYESWSTSEFGGEVSLAGGAHKGVTVSFLVGSYACEHGAAANCRTSPGASFSWPLTLEIYEAGAGASIGSRVTHVTRKFSIPYRPSASVHCPNEGWTQGFGAECSFALMHRVSFGLRATTFPKTAVVALAFNTRDYGSSPTHKSGPYDWLGVAVDAGYVCTLPDRRARRCPPGGLRNLGRGEPRVGSNPLSSQIFINTTYEPFVCGGPAGSFGATGACWSREQPALEVRAAS